MIDSSSKKHVPTRICCMRDVNDFGSWIRMKSNRSSQLRRNRAANHTFLGWQPLERRFQVVLVLGFVCVSVWE